jgi:hypothetical protein
MSNHSSPFDYLKPIPCPYPLIRIGGCSDGAYLVPDDLAGVKACFSPGVCNAKDFEDDLAVGFGIRSHMCDLSSDIQAFKTEIIEGMQTFEKKWLDLPGVDSSITLDQWVNKYEPASQSGDLILQMDIEGAEYRNLLVASNSCLARFRIIVLEIHGLDVLQNRLHWKNILLRSTAFLWMLTYRPLMDLFGGWSLIRDAVNFVGRRIGPHLLVDMLTRLDKTHACVHVHPNNCCGEFIDQKTGMNVPRVLEMTYLRKDRFSGQSSRFFTPQIPNPLDIVNMPQKKPIVLNSKWKTR